MRISFEAYPLFEDNKTGVSYCENGLVSSLTNNHQEDEFCFEYFSLRNHESKLEKLSHLMGENVSVSVCKWFPGRLYKMLTLIFPLPYRLFFGSKSDVTHFFNYVIPPFVGGKKVVTVHDLTFMVYPETMSRKTLFTLKMLAKRSMKRADKIVAVSEFTKSEIIRLFDIPSEKIDVVYNAVDLSVYRDDYAVDEIDAVRSKFNIPQSYMLYLGTIEPRKNLLRLINAYAMLRKEEKDVPALVIAGKKGWLYDSIMEAVEANGLSDDVIFTGYVSSEDAPKLMCGAKLFCYPSIYEGYGMPVLEAMACSVPVLTSNCSSLPEVSRDCAVNVDPMSEKAICDGMKKLLFDTELCDTLSKKGRALAEQSSWDVQAEKLHRIYDSLLAD